MKKLEEILLDKIKEFDIPDALATATVFMIFLILGASVHELSHYFTALLLGCKANVLSIDLFTGATSVFCKHNEDYILVALAGPFGALLFSLYMYFSGGKNSISRIASIVMLFYSVIPNLYPFGKGTDMYMAISFGLRPLVGIILFFIVFVIGSYLIALEIVDRREVFT